MRLLQFSGALSSESPQKHHLSYWNELIREYFTPGAVMRLTLWKDNQHLEAKPFGEYIFHFRANIYVRFALWPQKPGLQSCQDSFWLQLNLASNP